MQQLIENNVEILKPIRYIAENNSFIAYSQEQITPVATVTLSLIIFVLKNLKNMIINNMFCFDIYFNNIGIRNGKFCIFDIHEIEQQSRYKNNTSQILNYFIQLDDISNDFFFTETIEEIETKTYELLSNKKISVNACELIFALNDYFKYNEIVFSSNDIYVIKKIDIVIDELENKLKDTSRSLNHYQNINIIDGYINIQSHTLKKYTYAKEILDLNNHITSVIDYGCSIGGIGLRIAQDYPHVKVSMSNIDDFEVNTCSDFIQCSRLKNITVKKENVVDSQNSYDLTMYFALIHHVLKNKTISYVIDMVYSQTNIFSIIEVPIGNDALLKMVKENGVVDYQNSFKYLESIDLFLDIFSSKFKILKVDNIIYPNSPDLNRHVFIFKKIY